MFPVRQGVTNLTPTKHPIPAETLMSAGHGEIRFLLFIQDQGNLCYVYNITSAFGTCIPKCNTYYYFYTITYYYILLILPNMSISNDNKSLEKCILRLLNCVAMKYNKSKSWLLHRYMDICLLSMYLVAICLFSMH